MLHVTWVVTITRNVSRVTRNVSRVTRNVGRVTRNVGRVTRNVGRVTRNAGRVTRNVVHYASSVTRVAITSDMSHCHMSNVTRHGYATMQYAGKRVLLSACHYRINSSIIP